MGLSLQNRGGRGQAQEDEGQGGPEHKPWSQTHLGSHLGLPPSQLGELIKTVDLLSPTCKTGIICSPAAGDSATVQQSASLAQGSGYH